MDGASTKHGMAKDHMSKDHTEGMRARPLHVTEPIAARLGVDYPFPPHLEYGALPLFNVFIQHYNFYCVLMYASFTNFLRLEVEVGDSVISHFFENSRYSISIF